MIGLYYSSATPTFISNGIKKTRLKSIMIEHFFFFFFIKKHAQRNTILYVRSDQQKTA